VSHRPAIEAMWDEHLRIAAALRSLAPDVDRVVEMIGGSMAAGGGLLVCGNGGSAADAQHIAAELTGRFLRDRKPLRAMALHANTSSLTAIGNDYGYDEVFARQVAAYGRRGDVLVEFSTSGESENLIRAAQVAAERGITVVAVTGGRASRLAALADVAIRVPVVDTPLAQELHTVVLHVLCEVVEATLADAV
jgi:D-sedoheptulose 7-phosphate isomerase